MKKISREKREVDYLRRVAKDEISFLTRWKKQKHLIVNYKQRLRIAQAIIKFVRIKRTVKHGTKIL